MTIARSFQKPQSFTLLLLLLILGKPVNSKPHRLRVRNRFACPIPFILYDMITLSLQSFVYMYKECLRNLSSGQNEYIVFLLSTCSSGFTRGTP
ncbi:hypothetical protein IW261DRAFT_1451653 [Armillaria novae-zelandiae]|uniref:Secreted protein n=1 Tax=Armillaria novae-zelandiae TaxID=153914 RepID=A0AA39PK15_9AGAR|nr:hypothetical protein IW261DRAFT_1451653 [Armillaria novae-zelandiae]